MNREIKLRAWDEGNKVMHYDFQFIRNGTEGGDWIVFTSDKQKLSDKPHPFDNPFFAQQLKVQQFTSLKDKNGKEIYVGDILRFVDTETKRRAIGKVNERDDYYFYGIGKILFDEAEELEVIGNIYETPELLNKTEKEKI